MDDLVADVSKMKVYGSTNTLTTVSSETQFIQASSSEDSEMQLHMRPVGNENVDSSSIDVSNRFSSKKRIRNSGDSLFSDISSDDDSGGYYSRNTRYRNNACFCYHNSVFTWNNLKVLLSFAAWFVSYMIMGICGGSVAYMHFERSDRSIPDPLPDFGYDQIPYYCPVIPNVPHGNVQSAVLFILYAIILTGVVARWVPRFHPKSGKVISSGDGRLILQHLFHLNCLVFITRTTTVGMTGLPQPNPRCVEQQHRPVSFENALQFVMGRGFPPHACGDLIYSGHVGCTLICMAVMHRHGFLRNRLIALGMWIVAAIGIYFTISCRSHYTVDVILAFYFGYFLPEWYFNRSDGRIRGRISRWIRMMEVRPEDLDIGKGDDSTSAEEYIDGCSSEPDYPPSISV